MTRVQKFGRRHYAVYDSQDQLLAVCLYKKGAIAVAEAVDKLEKERDALTKEIGDLRLKLEAPTRAQQLTLFTDSPCANQTR
jgi:cell division protein FtsB